MKAESWRQKDVWKLGLRRRFVFQHSNNQNIHGEEWPPEDHSERSWLALNPTKNLWDELKIKIKAEQKSGGAWEIRQRRAGWDVSGDVWDLWKTDYD